MERDGLIVRERLHFAGRWIDVDDLWVQTRSQGGVNDGGIFRVRVDVGWDGDEECLAAVVSCSVRSCQT